MHSTAHARVRVQASGTPTTYVLGPNLKATLTTLLLLQFAMAFALIVCSFTLSDAAYVGLTTVVNAILYAVVSFASFPLLLQRPPVFFALGIYAGVLTGLSTLSLMTAVYWGQLAKCDPSLDGQINHYYCRDLKNVKAICAVAVCNLVVEASLLTFLFVTNIHHLPFLLGYMSVGPSNPHVKSTVKKQPSEQDRLTGHAFTGLYTDDEIDHFPLHTSRDALSL